MSFVVWNDRISVEVEELDADHKKMVEMINDLYDAILAGNGRKNLDRLLDRLVDYTRYHFAREEAWMERIGFPDLAAHKQEHEKMAAWINTAWRDYHSNTAMAPSLETMNLLKDWLFGHILGSDQKYAAFQRERVIQGSRAAATP